MKRWLILAGAMLLLASYAICYRYLPFRDASRFRHAEVFVHVREFRHEWQGRLFYPAAYIESLLIRTYPRPFLPHPSWSEYPQVLLLEAGDFRATFPRDAFHKA
jgi:hypothetical protein